MNEQQVWEVMVDEYDDRCGLYLRVRKGLYLDPVKAMTVYEELVRSSLTTEYHRNPSVEAIPLQ